MGMSVKYSLLRPKIWKCSGVSSFLLSAFHLIYRDVLTEQVHIDYLRSALNFLCLSKIELLIVFWAKEKSYITIRSKIYCLQFCIHNICHAPNVWFFPIPYKTFSTSLVASQAVNWHCNVIHDSPNRFPDPPSLGGILHIFVWFISV